MTDWQPPGGDVPYAGPPVTGRPPAAAAGFPPGYPPAPSYPLAPSYPPGYPPMGYPPAFAPAYPGYPTDPRDVRPGPTMAAAVLGYVNSGLLVLAGGLLLLGASIVSGIEHSDGSHTSYGVEFALAGIMNIVAAGLLIAGGVMITGRKPVGRALLSAGNGIVVALAICWIARFAGVALAGLLIYSLVFAALAIVAVVLAWLPAVSTWLSPRS